LIGAYNLRHQLLTGVLFKKEMQMDDLIYNIALIIMCICAAMLFIASIVDFIIGVIKTARKTKK